METATLYWTVPGRHRRMPPYKMLASCCVSMLTTVPTRVNVGKHLWGYRSIYARRVSHPLWSNLPLWRSTWTAGNTAFLLRRTQRSFYEGLGMGFWQRLWQPISTGKWWSRSAKWCRRWVPALEDKVRGFPWPGFHQNICPVYNGYNVGPPFPGNTTSYCF